MLGPKKRVGDLSTVKVTPKLAEVKIDNSNKRAKIDASLNSNINLLVHQETDSEIDFDSSSTEDDSDLFGVEE